MIPVQEFNTFLIDARAQLYLLAVILALYASFKRYFYTPTSNYNNKAPKSRPSLIPPLISLSILALTWFYILRFIVTYIHSSQSYFGDAYRDVLKDPAQYRISVQLLTWAIVAVWWIEEQGAGVADLAFLIYGFLGAMAAAFVLWVSTRDRNSNTHTHTNTNQKRKGTLSIWSVVCAIVAWFCIYNLSPCTDTDTVANPSQCEISLRFGSFRPSFEAYLKALHLVLLVPVVVAILPQNAFPYATRLHPAPVYGIAATALAAWHAFIAWNYYQGTADSGLTDGPYLPHTDCQISITIDILCCSLITLYVIYTDHRSDTNASIKASIIITVTSAVLLPIISPAALLAFHLGTRSIANSHMAIISKLQQSIAHKIRKQEVELDYDPTYTATTTATDTPSKIQNQQADFTTATTMGTWCNLGLWLPNENNIKTVKGTYDQACERLALALANAASLNSHDAVLCCGCGSGTELFLYKRTFNLRHITGIDPHAPNHVSQAELKNWLTQGDFNIRKINASVQDLQKSDMPLFPQKFFNKILALDNVYHYPSKVTFFRDCAVLLPPAGKIAVTDILVTDLTPWWIAPMLRPLAISAHNLWTKQQYTAHLENLGFVDIHIHSTNGAVFSGWRNYLPSVLTQYLDYCIVVASLPGQVDKNRYNTRSDPKIKKVAIIGSGLSGLAAAHTLVTSSKAAQIQVSIFEANDKLGLAANSVWYQDHLIDIPPRMASQLYYKEYRKLINDLHIPTQVVRADCTYYGHDHNSSSQTSVYAYYDKSSIVNLMFALFDAGFKNFSKVAMAMFQIGNDMDATAHEMHYQELKTSLTFHDWLKKHMLCSPTSTDRTRDVVDMCRDNPFLYLIVGSLGWMLSCTYQQLLRYPADIILPYLYSLYLPSIQTTGDGQVVRVNPSIQVLEQTLLYGVDPDHLYCGAWISDLDQHKVIDGISYDAVICATEASAVSHVLKDAPEIFSQVQYHPSNIYLHTDVTLMPPSRKDWRRWNVEMSAGCDEPQLTFWLNEVYPDSHFSTPVFQTWAPFHPPAPHTIIKKASFQRVVHTTDTPNLLEEIQRLQGRDRFYFAGSYTVYGMGLLEQALISGQKAAQSALGDLF